ncbi:hypothetical protein KY317_02430, partial [Candidatus Woesearchaeota archaeon]|nr:hypothetical protein [Candidatus Woesearchaeota archaeon]
IAYILINGLPDLSILIELCLGAVFGAPLGALLTKKMNSKNLRFILGVLIMGLGAWTILKLFI